MRGGHLEGFFGHFRVGVKVGSTLLFLFERPLSSLIVHLFDLSSLRPFRISVLPGHVERIFPDGLS